MKKQIKVIGAILGLSLSVSVIALAECFDVWNAGQCPNLSPTSPGTCATGCSTYYVYTPMPTYWAEAWEGGALKDCQPYYPWASYTQYDNNANLCQMLVPRCNYVAWPKLTQCQTISCQDLCGGG